MSSDHKPGYALSDRVRERTKKARAEYQLAVKAVYPDFEELTMPENNVPPSKPPAVIERPKINWWMVASIVLSAALASVIATSGF